MMNTGRDGSRRVVRNGDDGTATWPTTGGDVERALYEETTVAVVIPAYNESNHIGDVLESVPPFVDRIYAVDDASKDETWAEIRLRVPNGSGQVPDGGAPVDGRIVPIRHEKNQGAGGALRTGYERALEDGVDVTVAMDADGQMDPDQMAALLAPVVEGDADYAKGNRLLDAEYREAMPRFRQLGNWTLTILTKVASGYWKTMDPQNGYTAISHEALSAIDLDAMATGHDYTNDLLVRLNVAGMRVADVAMPAVYGEEESTIDYVEFVPKTATTLLRSFCWRLRRRYLARDFHPLALFYGAGVVSGAVGLVYALDAVRGRVGDGDGNGHSAVSAVLSLLFGCLFILRAMVLDMRDNEDSEVRRE